MSDFPDRAIGQKLKALRKAQYPNDSQSDFAARIKTSSRTYSRMEAGDTSVSFKNYLNAADILNVADRFDALFEKPSSPTESIETTFSDMFNRNTE